MNQLGCHRETELSELGPGEEARVAGSDVGSGEGPAVAFFSVPEGRTLVMWLVNSACQCTKTEKDEDAVYLIYKVYSFQFLRKTFVLEKVSAIEHLLK